MLYCLSHINIIFIFFFVSEYGWKMHHYAQKISIIFSDLRRARCRYHYLYPPPLFRWKLRPRHRAVHKICCMSAASFRWVSREFYRRRLSPGRVRGGSEIQLQREVDWPTMALVRGRDMTDEDKWAHLKATARLTSYWYLWSRLSSYHNVV